MNRRLLSLIGMILGALALIPAAEAVTPLCAQVQSTTPVSDYVRYVLTRSNAAITAAPSGAAGAEFDDILSNSALNTASLFRLLIDTQLTITQQAMDLPQNTACLHADSLQIQCQMEKVRDEIVSAYSAGKADRITVLEPQLSWLRDRLSALLRGAADPSYADVTWGQVSAMDPGQSQYWCCATDSDTCGLSADCEDGQKFWTLDGCVRASKCKAPASPSPEDSRVCPFDSDFGPAMKNGYGCDVSVMNAHATYQSITYERDTLQYLNDRLNQASQNLGLAAGSSSSSSSSRITFPMSHQVVQGCKRKYGYCSDDKTLACAENVDCVEANAGNCQFDLPTTVAWNGLRSPFTLFKDEFGIVAKFVTLRMQQGFSRQQAIDLKNAGEFSSQQSSLQAARSDEPFFTSWFRGGFRGSFRTWSQLQGRNEANPFIDSTDAQTTIANALPATGVGYQLAQLVKDPDQIRAFLERYAYFARRTCANRPCSQKLEQILKIAYSDSCFPYASGQYSSESPGNPAWQKCAQDSCIPLPGITLDGGKCICYKTNVSQNMQTNPTEVSPTDNPDVCFPRP